MQQQQAMLPVPFTGAFTCQKSPPQHIGMSLLRGTLSVKLFVSWMTPSDTSRLRVRALHAGICTADLHSLEVPWHI